jgi:hypothetical protein
MSKMLQDAESLAKWFHESYEALAPHHNYKTRGASAVPWEKVPQENRALMLDVCGRLLEEVSRVFACEQEVVNLFKRLGDWNPSLAQLIEEILRVHLKKSHDYTHGGNPYSNFEGISSRTGLPIDKVFQVQISVKEERLVSLLTEAKDPQNESILDTYLDQALYTLLRAAYAWKKAKIDPLLLSYGEIQFVLADGRVLYTNGDLRSPSGELLYSGGSFEDRQTER